MGDRWTAIDFETANHDRGSVCSVGLVRVEEGRIAERYTTLIKPPPQAGRFARFNIDFHGIGPEQVADAPEWPEAFRAIVDFADGGPLVAHNAAFDMGVIHAACAHTGLAWEATDYACSLYTARRTWPALDNHKLPTVCAEIGHDLLRHHAADADAEAAAHIMIAALRVHGVHTLFDLCLKTRRPLLRTSGLAARVDPAPLPAPVQEPAPTLWDAEPSRARPPMSARYQQWQDIAREPLPEPDPNADPAGALFGRVVCVSGDLAGMSKIEAWKRIAAAGGVPAKNVTKKTNVLVTGAVDGAKTAKHRQAEAYAAKGQRIEVVSEAEFTRRLG
ncbi:exonuclease domain-containing protein [Nocardiopsis ansamitocini]|uniref:DNA polymerase III subunit epsilon n=1 Tax=Nocardiopsis ansamitocini TaxID=1670832 RepID=A0A9W6UH51_9ACTN|nr:exonuclease domain-containing protein [Nocardiopsis ansamitocini]GLU46264.1 DNA polymerase III subunit epsilon [Nocardiopsis ansamitocini]